MAVTLTEANKLTKDALKKGVIETIVRESAVLELLPFLTIKGNALRFIREESTGSVGFRSVNEDYVTTNPTYSDKVENLTRLGSMVEVDRFIEYTQNIVDVRAEATASKSKAIANEFTRVFFNGDTSVNPLEFNGLDKRVLPENVINAELRELSAPLLHELIDTVQGGSDVIFMNKKTRRKVTELFMAQGAYIEEGQDKFGRMCQYFGDIRIAVLSDEILPNNEIYAIKFGADNGIVGIQSGELTAVDNGLRNNMYQTLIEWYVSIADMNPHAIAKIENVTL